MSNLAYACVPCNRHKGADVASINGRSGGIIRLFHPRKDRWTDHFRLKGSVVEPCTEIGSATIRLLRLNAPERIVERRILQDLGNYPSRLGGLTLHSARKASTGSTATARRDGK